MITLYLLDEICLLLNEWFEIPNKIVNKIIEQQKILK